MLYDPAWRQGTRADPFRLSTLIAWLEKQPAEQEYRYINSENCLLAQYFAAHGLGRVVVGPTDLDWGPGLKKSRRLPPGFDSIADDGPWTFGAALERARAAM